MKKILKQHWDKFFIIAILTLLFWRNYTPNTWLTGWDNLHPEFNFQVNIKRSVFSVWQEYQGLGLLAGMGHAADLPRQLILWLLSLVLPNSLLRYLYHFSMIASGTFATYFLAKFINKKKDGFQTAPLVASLFYLLSFASVQYFSFPFEPYSASWGMLPWMILFILKIIDQPSKKNWLLFLLVNFFYIPAGYIQTIFLVNAIAIGAILFLNLVSASKWQAELRKAFAIGLTIIFINAFWIIPAGYFSLTEAKVTQKAMMNLMITEQFIRQSNDKGKFTDLIFFKSPLINNVEDDHLLMHPWPDHLEKPLVFGIALTLFALAMVGIFSKNKKKKYFIVIFFLSLVIYLSTIPPFSWLNQLLRITPFLNQILRYPFTKTIAPALLSYSILISLGVSVIESKKGKLGLVLIPALIILSLPSFTGNYLHNKMKKQIPEDYFQLIDYFKNQPKEARIANFPQYSYWGWYYYKWGSIGSGSVWYGLEQPIMDRTFDVWSDELENYYWQIIYAISSRDTNLFEQTLEKYDIDYLVFDHSIYYPTAFHSGKWILENEKIVNKAENLSLEKEFGSVKIYKVERQIKAKSDVVLFEQLAKASNGSRFYFMDPAFANNGYYRQSQDPNYYYPFTGLFNQRPEGLSVEVVEKENLLTVKKQAETTFDGYQISQGKESTPSAEIKITEDTIEASIIPQRTYCHGQYHQFVTSQNNVDNPAYFNCGGDLMVDQGYLIGIELENIAGFAPLVQIFTTKDYRSIVDTRVTKLNNQTNYYFIPSLYQFDKGIGLNVTSRGFYQKSINQVNKVEIMPFPVNQLTKIQLEKGQSETVVAETDYQVEKKNPSFYLVKFNQRPEEVVLLQSFHPGWFAFYFQDRKIKIIKNHYRVNEWANGWQLPNKNQFDTIYLCYWPQLLQFFGFGITIGASLIILVKKNKAK